LINPCSLKGVDIFLALADRFPDTRFAAVPTWGADQDLLEQLRAKPNVSLLAPDDNIDLIWRQTRVLLVPSLWPETFGYVVPEAMLRGIPVIASNIGGLPEAKQGVEFLVDVAPGEWRNADFFCPSQNIDAWSDALSQLLTDQVTYEDCSRRSRAAAHEFLKTATTEAFEAKLKRFNQSSSASGTSPPTPTSHVDDVETSIKPIHPEFQRCIDEQPYSVVLDQIRLTVDRDVFPPDLGRCAQNMVQIIGRYQPGSALDMGCGTGYLALSLKQAGVPEVWAADVHDPAVACTRKNAEANAHLGPIHVTQSDLFKNLRKDLRFDLIVFNQPFGPGQGNPICGCGSDGGYSITRRFLEEAPAYLNDGGALIMAFSDREHERHSPETIAREMGYRVDVLLHQYYGESNNFIYEIRLPE
jgi:release factor glutamine methyltransferase